MRKQPEMECRPPHLLPSGDGDRQGDIPAEEFPIGGGNGLTPLPPRIHCWAATEGTEGSPELDAIAVNHFLDTLAQVALGIAARKLRRGKGNTPC